MFGYTYLAEKRRMKKLDAALAALQKIPVWSLKIAKSIYPESTGKDMKRKAAEYEVFIDDIEDNKADVNAILLRRYVEQVERLADIARKSDPASAGLGIFGLGPGFVEKNKWLIAGAMAALLVASRLKK